jgi:hypothetical protein
LNSAAFPKGLLTLRILHLSFIAKKEVIKERAILEEDGRKQRRK